jgi:hypothetical protein
MFPLIVTEETPVAVKHALHDEAASDESLIGLGSVVAGKAAQGILSYTMPPSDLLEIDPLIQIARDQLGEAAFEALQTEGRAMTIEQAVAYALDESDG